MTSNPLFFPDAHGRREVSTFREDLKMGEFLAGVAVTAFAVFLYNKIKDSKDRPSGGSGGGGGGGGGRDVEVK